MNEKELRQYMRRRLLSGSMDQIGRLRNHDFSREWSQEFETLMRNRLVVGAFRYGPMRCKSKPSYLRVSAMIARLELYEQTLNQEYLVDVANLAMLEFTEPPDGAYFDSQDDGEHVAEDVLL